MCGRYAASRHTDELVEQFDVALDATAEPVRTILKSAQNPPAGAPDYNVAPSKSARVVLERAPREKATEAGQAAPDGPGAAQAQTESNPPEPVRQLRLMTWGLVPGWAKDPSVGARMTNARAETLLEKPAYKKAALTRRLLVPADGWYEWQVSPVATDAKGKPRKQPFFMRRRDGDVVAMAGLYEFWRDRTLPEDHPDAWLTTFTIVTDAGEDALGTIHDRAPLVLERDEWATWLDPTCTDPAVIASLLAPKAPGRFEAYPVDRAVGSPRANGPGLIEPLSRDQWVGVVDPQTGELIGG